MNEPITREEDTDSLMQFRRDLRRIVVKHRTNRLELFYMLQFPDEITKSDALESINDPLHDLDYLAPDTVRQHKLYLSLRNIYQKMSKQAIETLQAAHFKELDQTQFRNLTSSMRRLDSALDRFDAALTASLTDVDELTGLLNRKAMERDLEQELAHLKRENTPLCIAMMDADYFKKVNDDFGHSFGDIVLEELAERFESSLRPRDRIYRYGGEEFLVILPNTSLHDAKKTMERLRQIAKNSAIIHENYKIIQTVSSGLALALSSDSSDDVIERADRALYEAKESGRDCVVISDS